MPSIDWSENQWKALLYAIHRNDCILLLGQDIPYEHVGGTLKPLTETLANELAQHIPDYVSRGRLDSNNLSQIAQYYCQKNGQHSLEEKISAFYESKLNTTYAYYQMLAELPFPFIINTNPLPDLLHHYFQEVGKSPIIKYYHFRRKNDEILSTGTVLQPLIFHLYGILDDPDSLVLTESDLLDFLHAILSDSPSLPLNVLSEIQSRRKNLLFVGFGFKQQWYLRILLHLLHRQGSRTPSFALELSTTHELDDIQSTILFYQENQYNLHIHTVNVLDFIQELYDRYTERYPSVSSASAVTNPEASRNSTVFLCYSEPNKTIAIQLAEQLADHDLNPRFRKNGNKNEHLMVEQAIEEADSFVVLQSRALSAIYAGSHVSFLQLQNRIAGLLRSIPIITQGADGHKAFISSAGLDTQLQDQLVYDCSTFQFVWNLIEQTERYGMLMQVPYHATDALLEAAKQFVGADRQLECDVLLKELQKTREQPQLYHERELCREIELILRYYQESPTQKIIVSAVVEPCNRLECLEAFKKINLDKAGWFAELLTYIRQK